MNSVNTGGCSVHHLHHIESEMQTVLTFYHSIACGNSRQNRSRKYISHFFAIHYVSFTLFK